MALQAGIAVCADAVLIPEVPYDLTCVAAKLRVGMQAGQRSALIVVAEGAMPAASTVTEEKPFDPMKASLSPGATGHTGGHVIDLAGHVAQTVALQLQRRTDHETYPLVLGDLITGGPPTAVDRQLGLGYGAGAVRALNDGESGVMVTFQPPDLKFVPLAKSINKVRTVPADSMFMQIARSLGILFGDEVNL